MDAIECLKTRRSVRAYTDAPVSKEIIEDIVDCGRLAATARNVQPWKFIVVRDAGMRKRIAEITNYGKFIEHAPVCIAVLCEDSDYYLEDGCNSTQNILNAARAHGLGSCWVAGDKKAYASDICDMLGAPENYKLVSLIALGYSEGAHPSPAKKPLSEVLCWDRY